MDYRLPQLDTGPSRTGRSPGRSPFLQRWRSVRGILFLLLVVATVPILVVQLVMNLGNLEERRLQEYGADLEVARAVAATFDAYVQDVLRQEQALGSALTLLEPFTQEQANQLLTRSAREYPTIRHFLWVDVSGEILASSNPSSIGQSLADRAYFQEVVQGKPWSRSDLLVGRFVGEITFTIARGLRDEQGELLGVVVAAIEPAELDRVLAVARRGDGAVAIIDSQGYGVYRYPGAQMSWDQRNWKDTQPGIAAALAGRESVGPFVSVLDGRERMNALVPIASMGWAAGANRPTDEVMGPIYADLVAGFAMYLIFALLAYSAATVGSKGITVPITRLREHALAIAGGDLSRRVRVSGASDLQDLAKAFNRMAEEVRIREERAARLLEAEAAARQQAEAARQRVNSILESIGDAFVTLDSQWRFTYVNEEAEGLFSIKREDVLGTALTDHWHDPEGSPFFHALRQTLAEQRPHEVEGYSRLLGTWIEARIYPSAEGVSAYIRDIAQRKRAEEALRENEERFREAFDHAPIGVALATLEGRFLQVNRALCDMLGYPEEELLGRTFQELTHPEDLESDLALLDRLVRGEVQVFHLEKRYIHREGHAIWGRLSATVVRNAQGEPLHTLAQIQDITEVRRAEEERQRTQMALQEFALVDDLTGLYNRRGFTTLAHQQVKLADRNGQELTMFFFDMDGLKQINDAFGHQEGDRALSEVAALLKDTFRTSDIVGRLGGDEFAALVVKGSGCIPPIERRLETGREVRNAGRERPYILSFSMGATCYDPARPCSLDALMALADHRMYEEKRRKATQRNWT